jgi:hypothetical protein
MSVMADSADKHAGSAPAVGFSLSRWSRLKRAGGDVAPGKPSSPAVSTPETGTDSVVADSNLMSPDTADTPLPPLSSISLVEDFTPFMQAKVPQALRQQALKVLFKEPHFNVMDGLDTYIDDYTQFEPISAAEMATLSSWKTIMNPPRQVVTPGGYAVDVESDEGKAVLLAREDAQMGETPATDEGNAGTAPAQESVAGESLPPPVPVHARYGKRVGDFAAMPLADTDTPDSLDSDPAIAPTAATLIPEKDA